ncbi:MAG: hypothetical protein ACREEM_46865 [Blastocatellia bacterium]
MARLSASNTGSIPGTEIPLSTKPGTGKSQGTDIPSRADLMAHNLSNALSKIERVSQVLRRFSVVVVSSTIISFGVLFVILLIGDRKPLGGVDWLTPLSLLFGCVALYGCASHEMWRKRGDALFEEISDEVERRIVSVAGDPKFEGGVDLLSRARLALRDFAHTSDLPFIPGKFGPTVYAAVNLLIPILILFSSRLLKP